MCETVPPLGEPMCVQVCGTDALTYVEREEERDPKEQPTRGEVEIGLEALVNKYGRQTVMNSIARLSKGANP